MDTCCGGVLAATHSSGPASDVPPVPCSNAEKKVSPSRSRCLPLEIVKTEVRLKKKMTEKREGKKKKKEKALCVSSARDPRTAVTPAGHGVV